MPMGSRVRLCGREKKDIWGTFNLHELSAKGGKTEADSQCEVGEPDLCKMEALLPMLPVRPDDGVEAAFIEGSVKQIVESPPIFHPFGDVSLCEGRDLGVRDNG